ncbi:MAG: hypothetical protein O2945_00630 [Planctomycetota bacterium]|nr:hypothetical protein [Planctomycetota bacterium]MDA0917550.1 hypothetical protein [Planctomycetota bacterium]
MPAPFTPIIIATATAGIGWLFQNRSATIANEREHRKTEIARAQEVLKEVSHATDTLHYYLRNGAMYAAIRKATNDETRAKDDEQTWNGYENAVLQWKSHRTRFAAQVKRYFGNDLLDCLLAVQSVFDQAEDDVEHTYYKTRKSLATADCKANVRRYNERLDALEGPLMRLSELMIQEIQNENVGALRS